MVIKDMSNAVVNEPEKSSGVTLRRRGEGGKPAKK